MAPSPDTTDPVSRSVPVARPAPSDAVLLAACGAVVVGAVTASIPTTLTACVAALVLVGVIDGRVGRWGAVLVVAAGLASCARSTVEHDALNAAATGPHEGWVTVVGEPRESRHATRAVLSVDGRRYEVWQRDPDLRARLASVRSGQQLYTVGDRRALSAERLQRVGWQHVVGAYRLVEIIAERTGGPLARIDAAVRRTIERGSAFVGEAHRGLFAGLIIGERRGQSPEVIQRFRDSGLSHLTVVSGLNVTMLLLVVAPLVVRLPPLARWLITLAVLAWFAGLTRFEPSIMRASVMAALSVTAFTTGRDRDPTRLLVLAVILLVLVDPLLVRSVGFWLSVGATAGVCAVGPRLSQRFRARVTGTPLGRSVPLRMLDMLAITLGAQVGVAIPLVVTFGAVPVVSVPANLVAVPVASLVKLYGLPASLVAGTVPVLGPALMFPAAVGTAFVDWVAAVAAAREPGGWVSVVVWFAVVLGVVATLRSARRRGATTGGAHGRVSDDGE